MIVSVHQPNYLPWVGLFEKIFLSDIFVFFDNVQIPKNKSFVSRNKIFYNHKTIWLTVPIEKKGLQRIHKVKIVNDFWKKKHLNTIYHAYNKQIFFADCFNQIKKTLLNSHNYLADLNIEIIKEILKMLNIRNVKIIRASQLPLTKDGAKSIPEILNLLNAKTYLSGSGTGSVRYLDNEEFKRMNIQLKFCNTKIKNYYPFYNEGNDIVSILDLLFCKGPKTISKIFSNL